MVSLNFFKHFSSTVPTNNDPEPKTTASSQPPAAAANLAPSNNKYGFHDGGGRGRRLFGIFTKKTPSPPPMSLEEQRLKILAESGQEMTQNAAARLNYHFPRILDAMNTWKTGDGQTLESSLRKYLESGKTTSADGAPVLGPRGTPMTTDALRGCTTALHNMAKMNPLVPEELKKRADELLQRPIFSAQGKEYRLNEFGTPGLHGYSGLDNVPLSSGDKHRIAHRFLQALLEASALFEEIKTQGEQNTGTPAHAPLSVAQQQTTSTQTRPRMPFWPGNYRRRTDEVGSEQKSQSPRTNASRSNSSQAASTTARFTARLRRFSNTKKAELPPTLVNLGHTLSASTTPDVMGRLVDCFEGSQVGELYKAAGPDGPLAQMTHCLDQIRRDPALQTPAFRHLADRANQLLTEKIEFDPGKFTSFERLGNRYTYADDHERDLQGPLSRGLAYPGHVVRHLEAVAALAAEIEAHLK
ncbi:hypothetical protein EGT07_13340 [Herbaspirillum sp. HC18]|nr:hypothetical protein EGT07_13340 [Herbaspirillum sp. HC18]